jgi:hypothetical protein
MNGISPLAAAANDVFRDGSLTALYSRESGKFKFNIYATTDSIWLLAEWPNGAATAFRMAYAPDGTMAVKTIDEGDAYIDISLVSVVGCYKIILQLKEQGFRYKTKLTPNIDLLIPFWPRDIVIPGDHNTGTIHASQVGTRSGLIYFSLDRPKCGSVLYLQNLTALNDYCQQTETSAGNTVGGTWPELGFALPPTTEKPIIAGTAVVVSDAIVVLSDAPTVEEPEVVTRFLDMLGTAYLQLRKPDTQYHDWHAALDKGLKDLIDSPGCWSQLDGHQYFNAYVSDYDTPPEIMVQLAVLLPLLDYVEWSGKTLDVMRKIKEGLPSFYNEKLKTIMRWHPAAADKLAGEEEQKKPMVMDSWYLHHPLLNLSRLALKGDEQAKKLFLDSLGYAIKVAHHFNYEWPVFYHMETLETIKAETRPGKGGEKDVPGLYAHVMLQAYELTGEKKYLSEAEKAAVKLKGLGFELLYQANNTAFSSGALLRLYKLTKKEIYKELSYLCLANIFKNVQLWDCNYGFGKSYPTFFALFPLSDAPYTAVYEEQEVFCALHDYLKQAEGLDILPSVSLLVAEYIRYVVHRAIYYYPPMLPKAMLKEKPKVGEVDPKLWIALEDLHDGWEQSGEVGQEVYGAGNAFGILPRHYLLVPGEDFMVFVDYPTSGFKAREGAPVTFKVLGDGRVCCRLVLVKREQKLPEFKMMVNKRAVKGKTIKGGHLEYLISGDADIKISWK